MESYKHAYAKETVARWLREPTFESFDAKRTIKTEYPVAIDKNNELNGLYGDWDGLNPDYDWLIAHQWLPLCIFDIAILHNRYLVGAIEIVHKNAVSKQKAEYVNRIGEAVCSWPYFSSFYIATVDADWVLSQCAPPAKIQHTSFRLWDSSREKLAAHEATLPPRVQRYWTEKRRLADEDEARYGE